MENILIIKIPTPISELRQIAKAQFGDMIKAVVDIEKELVSVGGEFHVDMQTLLVEKEYSKGEFTWGINLYLDKSGPDFIEFDSMINLKPRHGNRSRNIEDTSIQEKIKKIVNDLIIR